MFEIFGGAASPAPGIQELETRSGHSANAAFDFDEILQREQGEQNLRTLGNRPSELQATARGPVEDSTHADAGADHANVIRDGEPVDPETSPVDQEDPAHTPLVAVVAVEAGLADEIDRDSVGNLPNEKVDPVLISATLKGTERQSEAVRLEFGGKAEMTAADAEEGMEQLAMGRRPQPSALDLLDFNEMMDPDLVVEKAPAQIITRLSQIAATSAPHMEELAETIVPQITRGIATLVRNGTAEMRLQLQPPDLGEIELRVRTTEASVRGHVVVQHSELKQLLEAQLDKLRASLEEQGLAMEGFDVSVGRDGQFGTTEQGWEATRPHPGGRADGVANGGIEGGSPGPILVRGADNGDVDFIA